MDIKKIKRRHRERKEILINIRITRSMSKWLKEQDYSPTAIFYEAVKDLGYQREFREK